MFRLQIKTTCCLLSMVWTYWKSMPFKTPSSLLSGSYMELSWDLRATRHLYILSCCLSGSICLPVRHQAAARHTMNECGFLPLCAPPPYSLSFYLGHHEGFPLPVSHLHSVLSSQRPIHLINLFWYKHPVTFPRRPEDAVYPGS